MSFKLGFGVLANDPSDSAASMHLIVAIRAQRNSVVNIVTAPLFLWDDMVHLNRVKTLAETATSPGFDQ